MVPVGTAHVGSVVVAVTVGAPAALPTVTSVEASQPAAFFTHTLCAPVLMPVKPPAGYGRSEECRVVKARTAVGDVTSMVHVGTAQVGSVAVAGTVGARGEQPNVTSE